MSVKVEASEFKSRNFSYVLIFTDPLGMMQSIGGVTVVIEPDDALRLHDQLGIEIGCDDPNCPCFAYGFEQGKEVGRSQA